MPAGMVAALKVVERAKQRGAVFADHQEQQEGTIMTLVRWSPVRDVFAVRDEMSRLLEEALGRSFGPESRSVWQPAVDIEELPDRYTVRAELPGVKQEDIRIILNDDHLVIRGEKRREEEKKDSAYHRVERLYG